MDHDPKCNRDVVYCLPKSNHFATTITLPQNSVAIIVIVWLWSAYALNNAVHLLHNVHTCAHTMQLCKSYDNNDALLRARERLYSTDTHKHTHAAHIRFFFWIIGSPQTFIGTPSVSTWFKDCCLLRTMFRVIVCFSLPPVYLMYGVFGVFLRETCDITAFTLVEPQYVYVLCVLYVQTL